MPGDTMRKSKTAILKPLPVTTTMRKDLATPGPKPKKRATPRIPSAFTKRAAVERQNLESPPIAAVQPSAPEVVKPKSKKAATVHAPVEPKNTPPELKPVGGEDSRA